MGRKSLLLSNWAAFLTPAPACSMFRIGDIQNSTVVSPRVHCFMYTWGDGRVTAEGEHIPVCMQELHIDYW